MSIKSNKLDKNCVFHIAVLRLCSHFCDIIMGAMASQIISVTIVYSAVYSDADRRKHQSPASLAFVSGIHRWPMNSPYKGPVTRKTFPFDDVIMSSRMHGRVFSCLFAITLNAWKFHNTTTYICRSMLTRWWHTLHIIIWYWKTVCSGIYFLNIMVCLFIIKYLNKDNFGTE